MRIIFTHHFLYLFILLIGCLSYSFELLSSRSLEGWKSRDNKIDSSITLTEAAANDFISAHIYYAPAPLSQGVFNCSPNTIGSGVPNITVTLDTEQGHHREAITDASGLFVLQKPPSNSIITIEAFFYDNYSANTTPKAMQNGLTTVDIGHISRHISGIKRINCPLTRIAADFDQNGKIESKDMDDMRAQIIGTRTQADYDPLPIWRLVPNATTYPSLLHPDSKFTSEYWTSMDIANKEYPFDATLHLREHQFNYLGNLSSSWMNRLSQWKYTGVTETCDKVDYGFWLIKAGDINRSANVNLYSETQKSVPIAVNEFEYTIKHSIQSGLEARTTEPIKLVLKVKSKKNLDAFQMGLKIDTSLFSIEQINPITSDITQRLDVNFNTHPTELEQGHVRTLWFNESIEEFPKGVPIQDWTEVLDIDIQYKGTGLTEEQFIRAVLIEAAVMQTEFVSGSEILSNKEIEIQMELRTQ